MMRPQEILLKTQNVIVNQGLTALFIPISDPHFSEYINDEWNAVKTLTGFTGSTGNAIVTSDFSGLWTDSRYFIQAEQQLANSGTSLMKLKVPHTPEFLEWIDSNFQPGDKIGYNGKLLSIKQIENYTKATSSQEWVDIGDKFDFLFPGKADIKPRGLFELDAQYTGSSRSSKLENIRSDLKSQHAQSLLLTALDDIAWIFNLRGFDFKTTPVFYAFAVITHHDAFLYVNLDQVDDRLRDQVDAEITLLSYNNFDQDLPSIQGPIATNFSKLSIANYATLKNGEEDLINYNSIPARRSIKDHVQLENYHKATIKDGLALVRFYSWLEEKIINEEKVSEYDLSVKINMLREEQGDFLMPSFSTIVGFRGNGANNHYAPQKDTAAVIESDGMLLIDSGGQYLQGTTDITRTIYIGKASSKHRRDYTLVLKGMIGLERLHFPAGKRGDEIEVIARQYMWEQGIDYGHGTGHGVGFCLGVHEGPQSFGRGATASSEAQLQEGMVLTIEPGIYHPEKYGIREENMVVVRKSMSTSFGTFLKFEPITLFPFSADLIDPDLLTNEEVEYINSYHSRVYKELSSYLDEAFGLWLKAKCQPIKKVNT